MSDIAIHEQIKNDAKHALFSLARYKFISKMFTGFNSVLEIGCGNGSYYPIVEQTVDNLRRTDITELDITKDFISGFDGVYCLDVFEHVSKEDESAMLVNLAKCATVCIIGTPSLESQLYASKLSKELHVNCVTGNYLHTACKKYWKSVFMFSMNDEVLHTGFLPMSHYLLALCVAPHESSSK